MVLSLNFPWVVYPNQMCSGYTNLKHYRYELIRLYNTINNYKVSKNNILQIIIGASMEEKKEYNQRIGNQYSQLFPYYIEYLLENTDNKIMIIIIAPNKNFESEYEPEFIKHTDYYNWSYNKENKEYVSKDVNITIKIFNTMFPSNDKTNKEKIEHMKKFSKSESLKYIQTVDDKEFIDIFYNKLEEKINEIEINNGFIFCISYANFRKGSIFNKCSRNYGLFPDIKNIFKNKPNRLLCDWVFDDSNFILERFQYKHNINYGINHNSSIIELNTTTREIIIINYD